VVGNVPLQPPDAAQVLALVALHCSVTDAPMATALSLAFKVTKGGAATAGVDAVLLVAVPLGAEVLDVSAFELSPHAARKLSAANTNIDFNANANPERRLRRIELITRLPIFTATTFSAELDSIRPQSLSSHIHSIFRIRQPVAICELHMFSGANKFIRVLEVAKLARANFFVAHWRHELDRVSKDRKQVTIFLAREKYPAKIGVFCYLGNSRISNSFARFE